MSVARELNSGGGRNAVESYPLPNPSPWQGEGLFTGSTYQKRPFSPTRGEGWDEGGRA